MPFQLNKSRRKGSKAGKRFKLVNYRAISTSRKIHSQLLCHVGSISLDSQGERQKSWHVGCLPSSFSKWSNFTEWDNDFPAFSAFHHLAFMEVAPNGVAHALWYGISPNTRGVAGSRLSVVRARRPQGCSHRSPSHDGYNEDHAGARRSSWESSRAQLITPYLYFSF